MSIQSVPRRFRLASHAAKIQRRESPPSSGAFVMTLPTLVARIQRSRSPRIAAPTIVSDAPFE